MVYYSPFLDKIIVMHTFDGKHLAEIDDGSFIHSNLHYLMLDFDWIKIGKY